MLTFLIGFIKLCRTVVAWCVEPLSLCTRRVCNEKGKRRCSFLSDSPIYVVQFVLDTLNHWGFVRGEFVKKREWGQHKEEIGIVYDSRSKSIWWEQSFIILRTQDFTEITMLDWKDTLFAKLRLELWKTRLSQMSYLNLLFDWLFDLIDPIIPFPLFKWELTCTWYI